MTLGKCETHMREVARKFEEILADENLQYVVILSGNTEGGTNRFVVGECGPDVVGEVEITKQLLVSNVLAHQTRHAAEEEQSTRGMN